MTDAQQIASEPWDIGTGVRGYHWRAPEARAALLLQHGYAEYAERYIERYNRLIPHLLGIGLDVYAFDMRGHGRSAGPRCVTDLGEAVEHHLTARRKLASAGPVFLFGHSLGGLITAASVARDQEGVAAVVLSSPALHVKSNAVDRGLARTLVAVAPGIGVKPPTDPKGLSHLSEQVRLFATDPMIYQGWVPARLGATLLAVAGYGWKRYTEWRAPTYIIHGTADTITDPEGSRRFAAMIRSADKRLDLIEGGYHELLNDTERDTVLEGILAWLRDRLLTRAAQ